MGAGIEEMKTMKTQLMSCVQGQMGQLDKTDAKELGEAVDMIKDLAEAIYYCTITEAMEKGDQKQKETVNNINYYTAPTGYTGKMYPDYYRDMERTGGYMYYPGGNNGNGGQMYYMGGNAGNGNNTNGGQSGNTSSTAYYTEMPYGMGRDPREGRAAIRRRMYMEGKEMHKDTNSQLKELEAYLQELSSDITEMIKDASPEERATLHQKMATLANKIA